jgi:hypothetical protein
MMSIIGAVAFAALLAWGLTFGSGVVQADDETPTATVEADETATVEADETPTVEATETPAAEYCGPVFPTTFAGTVTIDGAPAPDGTTITAIGSDGVTWGTASTSGGSYNMDVPATMPVTEPCFPGGTISFTCDGASATETGSATGGLKDLNLTCGPIASPTATVTVVPTPTVEPTPEATPTVLPPTGMGGMSGDGGFMWWPLALTAAALTSVAGLLTARWARR